MNHQVRTNDRGPKLGGREKSTGAQGGGDGHRILWVDALGNGFAWRAQLGQLEFLASVGCAVDKLPTHCGKKSSQALEHQWNFGLVTNLQVLFCQVWIMSLTQVAVMMIVVFHIPCLGHHPVKPIVKTPPG